MAIGVPKTRGTIPHVTTGAATNRIREMLLVARRPSCQDSLGTRHGGACDALGTVYNSQ